MPKQIFYSLTLYNLTKLWKYVVPSINMIISIVFLCKYSSQTAGFKMGMLKVITGQVQHGFCAKNVLYVKYNNGFVILDISKS